MTNATDERTAENPVSIDADCSQAAVCGAYNIGGCLDSMADEIRTVNRLNGWNVLEPEQWGETYKIPAIIALIHSEVSEALEAFRKDDADNFLEEMADVVIRVLDCVGGLTDEFNEIVMAKIEKNRHRPHRHGGKRV